MESVASDAPLQAAGAHGAQLKKGGGETTLAEGRQSADGVVAQDHGGLLEVKLCGGRLQGEDAGESLAADLVLHVVRVGKGANDDLPLLIVPPPQDHAPAVQGGVPGDDDNASEPRFPGRKGCVEGAGHEGPEGGDPGSRTP